MPERNGQPLTDDPLAVLRRIRYSRPRQVPRPGERCELCGDGIGDDHQHLVDTKARNLMCACRGCYLLFVSEGAGGGHYRAVPERYVAFPGFQLSRAQWDAMQIPVSVAFFFLNSELGRVAAFYPSPAGATESELPLDKWTEISMRQTRSWGPCNPMLRRSWCGPAPNAERPSVTWYRSTCATSW